MADSTLNAIRTKVRRLTLRPSDAQISNAQIDEYVNTFVLYDFPEHLRLFIQHIPLSFFLTPNKDSYSIEDVGLLTKFPFTADFKDTIITINPPVYINGRQALFSQSENEFYGIYPKNKSTQRVGTGNGVNAVFSYTLQQNVIPGSINVGSLDANNLSLVLFDIPNAPFDGTGQLATLQSNLVSGTINYVTGQLQINFPGAVPGSTQPVWVSYESRTTGVPESMLYFGREFTFRPIPDKSYEVRFEVYVRPSELLSLGQSPELEQWWQYIAYGAAKKVFEDNMEVESIARIMPEFKKQETLVLRRTIVQNTNNRVATIYTEQSTGFGNNFFNGF